jgi:hypothetical protein
MYSWYDFKPNVPVFLSPLTCLMQLLREYLALEHQKKHNINLDLTEWQDFTAPVRQHFFYIFSFSLNGPYQYLKDTNADKPL